MGVTCLMKDRVIEGDHVVLVPYKPIHVPKYHDWMKDPELLYLTGSEPLSLEEEYEMQDKWVKDEDKITFIVLNKELFSSTGEVESMVGDTNIYFDNKEDLSVGEIEVMIADKSSRGKGLGQEVVRLMIKFSKEIIGVKRLLAKIKDTNTASINLFQRKLGFQQVSHSDVFQETTFQLDL